MMGPGAFPHRAPSPCRRATYCHNRSRIGSENLRLYSSAASWPSRAANMRIRCTRRSLRKASITLSMMARIKPSSSLRSMQLFHCATHSASLPLSWWWSSTALYRSCLVGKWRKIMASVTPAAAAISLVVVPPNPLREKASRAVSRSCRRRSLAGRRRVGGRSSLTGSIVSQYLLTVKRRSLLGCESPHDGAARAPGGLPGLARRSSVSRALLQLAIEEVHGHLLQLARRGAGDAVSLLRVQHELELLARQLQGIGHLQGVLEQHVVILEIVKDEELAFQVCRFRGEGGVLIAVGILLGQAHVALGVDGVVVDPTGHWRAGDARVEDVGRIEHGVNGHEAAVAGAGDADARGVGESERDQVFDAGHLVGQFGNAELVIDGGFESVPATHDAAVLALPDHVPLMGVDLIDIDSGPRVADRPADSGTTVNRHDYGILLARLEPGGFDEAPVKLAAVGSLEFDDLGGPYVVLVGLRAITLAIDGEFLAVAGVQGGAGGRGEVGIRVQIERAGGAHGHGVGVIGGGQLAFGGSIQLDGIEVPLDWRRLAGGVVEAVGGFVHRVDRGDFPIAPGQLPDALAVVGREKDVAEAAVALAGP